MLLLEIEKKENKKQENFSETTRIDWREPSIQSEQAEPEQ